MKNRTSCIYILGKPIFAIGFAQQQIIGMQLAYSKEDKKCNMYYWQKIKYGEEK